MQPGSGNVNNVFLKEDVTSDDYLVQAKTTEAASYRLSKKEFDQTESRALRQMKCPLWRVTIQDQTDLAIMRWQDFEQLLLDAKNANPDQD